MRDGIKIGPVQIKKPEGALARIKLEVALGNSVTFVPCGWKYIRKALGELTDPTTVNGALLVMKKLTDDCRYNRNWTDSRQALIPVIHTVLPYATDLKVIRELTDLLSYSRQHTYLTRTQMLELALPVDNYYRTYKCQLMCLSSVNIFSNYDVIDLVAKHVPSSGSGEFADQVDSLRKAAQGASSACGQDMAALLWPAVRRLWRARMENSPVDNFELTQFLHRFRDDVHVVVDEGQFTVRFEAAPKGETNEAEETTPA